MRVLATKCRSGTGKELKEEGVELSEVGSLLLNTVRAVVVLHLDSTGVHGCLTVSRARVEGRKDSVERSIVKTTDTEGLIEALSHVRVVGRSHLLVTKIFEKVLDLFVTTLATGEVLAGGSTMSEVGVRGGVGGHLAARVETRGELHVRAAAVLSVVRCRAATLWRVDARRHGRERGAGCRVSVVIARAVGGGKTRVCGRGVCGSGRVKSLLGGEGRVAEVAGGRVHGWVWVDTEGSSVLRHAVGSCCCILRCLVLALLLVLLGVDALVLLEILWTLEGLAADIAVVRLEWGVDTNVGGDVVTLSTANIAAFPLASEAKVVGRLATDVVVAKMLVDNLGIIKDLSTVIPSTCDGLGRSLKVGVV